MQRFASQLRTIMTMLMLLNLWTSKAAWSSNLDEDDKVSVRGAFDFGFAEIDEKTLQDLSFDTSSMGMIADDLHTLSGRLLLASDLKGEVIELQAIKARQQAIREILKDKELYCILEDFFGQYRKSLDKLYRGYQEEYLKRSLPPRRPPCLVFNHPLFAERILSDYL